MPEPSQQTKELIERWLHAYRAMIRKMSVDSGKPDAELAARLASVAMDSAHDALCDLVELADWLDDRVASVQAAVAREAADVLAKFIQAGKIGENRDGS